MRERARHAVVVGGGGCRAAAVVAFSAPRDAQGDAVVTSRDGGTHHNAASIRVLPAKASGGGVTG